MSKVSQKKHFVLIICTASNCAHGLSRIISRRALWFRGLCSAATFYFPRPVISPALRAGENKIPGTKRRRQHNSRGTIVRQLFGARGC